MEMRNRHNIPLEAAKKEDKASFLKIMADDVTRGRIKYFKATTDSLISEQESLQWKDETKQIEDPRIPNHCNDAMLYSWREARNYLWKEQPKPEDIDSNEYMDAYAKQLSDMRRKQNEYQY
jgi:hypothetical protein